MCLTTSIDYICTSNSIELVSSSLNFEIKRDKSSLVSFSFKAISACASNPCLNGGSCYKFEDSFICSCTPYYTGDTCDKAKVFTTTQPTTAGCMYFYFYH